MPDDFLWGAATAAHQVEGNQHNNWSEWEESVATKLANTAVARLKASVLNWEEIKKEATDPSNYISGLAADHYNRYEEDFDLMKNIGLNAYRFSIEWSRIEPSPGKYDKAEIDHYKQVVKALKKRGIEPMVSLHHFSDPIWLEEIGGWHGSEIIDRFVAYSKLMAEQLSPDVKYWISINEPGSYMVMRYLGGGIWPEWPKTSSSLKLAYAYLKNLVKIQKQVRLVIKDVNKDAMVGMAHTPIDYHLGRKDPISFIAKKVSGYIPDMYLINRLKKDLDFIGINYYLKIDIKAKFSHPSKWITKWDGKSPRSDSGWGIYPKGIYTTTQRFKKFNLPLFITENGLSDAKDRLRAKFITEHLEQLVKSKNDGADIRGYFHWSLLDNYEWSEGFWPKFGLIAVDRKTLKRTLRPSAKTYGDLIKKYSLIRS